MDKIVGGLLSAEDGETSNVILDLLGYDGFPACYAMAKVAAGARGVGGGWIDPSTKFKMSKCSRNAPILRW